MCDYSPSCPWMPPSGSIPVDNRSRGSRRSQGEQEVQEQEGGRLTSPWPGCRWAHRCSYSCTWRRAPSQPSSQAGVGPLPAVAGAGAGGGSRRGGSLGGCGARMEEARGSGAQEAKRRVALSHEVFTSLYFISLDITQGPVSSL